MSKNDHGLGRGFESLIPTQIVEEALDPTAKKDEKLSQLLEIDLNNLEPNREQPRQDFDEKGLRELADSIKAHGILQPLVVTKIDDNKYRIIAGERRYRASKLAGLTKVPVVLRSLNAQHTLEVALIENVQRLNLQPLELATAYLKLHDQFNMTYKQIGQRVGKTLGAVNNTVRILSLPPTIKEALQNHQITEGHAKALLGLTSTSQQIEALKLIIDQGWSVRRAESYVYNENHSKKDNKITKAPSVSSKTQTTATKQLAQRLRMPVYLQPKHRGGRLVVEYKTQAELEKLLNSL